MAGPLVRYLGFAVGRTQKNSFYIIPRAGAAAFRIQLGLCFAGGIKYFQSAHDTLDIVRMYCGGGSRIDICQPFVQHLRAVFPRKIIKPGA